MLNDAYLVRHDPDLESKVAQALDSIHASQKGLETLLDRLCEGVRIADGHIILADWGDMTWNELLKKREIVRCLQRARDERAVAKLRELFRAECSYGQWQEIVRPALGEAIDRFELFFKSSAQSKKQAARLATEAEPSLITQELNLDTLAAYLAVRLPDRVPSESKDYSDLIGQLKAIGYKTIGEVDQLLSRTADAFAAYKRAQSPGAVFSRTGVVRISGYILSPEFARMVWRDTPPSAFDKYRELVKSERAR